MYMGMGRFDNFSSGTTSRDNPAISCDPNGGSQGPTGGETDFQISNVYSPNKRSFRGPGGVGRGLDFLRGPKSVHGNCPRCPPRCPPTTLVLGGRQKAVHPQLCPRRPPHCPHGPRCPRCPPWLPLVPCVALERPAIILEGPCMGRFLARDCCLPLPRRFVAPKLL
jgi:hypothetical protein